MKVIPNIWRLVGAVTVLLAIGLIVVARAKAEIKVRNHILLVNPDRTRLYVKGKLAWFDPSKVGGYSISTMGDLLEIRLYEAWWPGNHINRDTCEIKIPDDMKSFKRASVNGVPCKIVIGEPD